jgi:5,6-dimethylbenzimidazole synthase
MTKQAAEKLVERISSLDLSEQIRQIMLAVAEGNAGNITLPGIRSWYRNNAQAVIEYARTHPTSPLGDYWQSDRPMTATAMPLEPPCDPGSSEAVGAADRDTSPEFGSKFREDLIKLCMWRRDVRRFDTAPVPRETIDQLLDIAQLSPSVGNSQPWRWVEVTSRPARSAVQASFRLCNASALKAYAGDQARAYATLKLEGLEQAPVQFAVFCDHSAVQGHGLGRATMPETLDYSVVSAISVFWLAARAFGLGVGWVSILERDDLRRALDVPSPWRLIAYLCVGWPLQHHTNPELERLGWQSRTDIGRRLLVR